MILTCPDCGNTEERHGKAQRCRSCAKLAVRKWRHNNLDICTRSTRAWREANPEKAKATQALWRRNNPIKAMIRNARCRARATGRDFSITEADVKWNDYCPVLGCKLEVGEGAIKPNSPSLDRIDNSKGYTPGNIVVVSMRANNIKSGASIAELRAIADFYEAIMRKDQ